MDANGDKTGRWFDSEKADYYEEGTWWNGSNHISLSTGSQWHHEAIFITPGKVYILKFSSQYQKVPTTYQQITKEEAAQWFIRNEYPDDSLPQEFKKEIKDLEVE